MPPMLSDNELDESDDGRDFVPARAEAIEDNVSEEEQEDDDDDDDDENEDDDVFVVEKIIDHNFHDDGSVLYQVKWLGYERKKDLTWEPIENLQTAKDTLDAYHKSIGGVPKAEPEPEPKKKKGKRAAPVEKSTRPAKKGRPSKSVKHEVQVEKKRELPSGSWESLVRIENIIKDEVHDEKKGGTIERLYAVIDWNNGTGRTQHTVQLLRSKCPQRLLDYYESHLRFTPTVNGDKGEDDQSADDA